MGQLKYAAIRGMFEALWAAQVPGLLRFLSRSKGVIFTLHRVLPERPADFSPNAILQVTPQFLDYAIERVRDLDLDVVDLDEAIRRISERRRTRKFVVFTFDDGYHDNLQHALPILRRHKCPFTIYLPTALVDGVGEVWWQALEDMIAQQDAVSLSGEDGEARYFDTSTDKGKHAVYDGLYWQLRKMPEPERVALIRDLAARYGLDLEKHCRELIMDWSELKTFAADPLCTIGAHTVHHYELAKLPEPEARNEIEQSVSIIRSQFGKAPTHLSYPIGGLASAGPREYAMARELGLRSAVTTRPGGLAHRHKDFLTALPRVSLNGLFQSRRYVDVFATGTVFSVIGRVMG